MQLPVHGQSELNQFELFVGYASLFIEFFSLGKFSSIRGSNPSGFPGNTELCSWLHFSVSVMISFHLNSFLLMRTQQDRTINNIKNKLLKWRAGRGEGGGGRRKKSTVKLRFSFFHSLLCFPFTLSTSVQQTDGHTTQTKRGTQLKFMFVCINIQWPELKAFFNTVYAYSSWTTTFEAHRSVFHCKQRLGQWAAIMSSFSVIFMLPCIRLRRLDCWNLAKARSGFLCMGSSVDDSQVKILLFLVLWRDVHRGCFWIWRRISKHVNNL